MVRSMADTGSCMVGHSGTRDGRVCADAPAWAPQDRTVMPHRATSAGPAGLRMGHTRPGAGRLHVQLPSLSDDGRSTSWHPSSLRGPARLRLRGRRPGLPSAPFQPAPARRRTLLHFAIPWQAANFACRRAVADVAAGRVRVAAGPPARSRPPADRASGGAVCASPCRPWSGGTALPDPAPSVSQGIIRCPTPTAYVA